MTRSSVLAVCGGAVAAALVMAVVVLFPAAKEKYVSVGADVASTAVAGADGRLDFAAAIEAVRAAGATPQNNAAILIVQAVGTDGNVEPIDKALAALGATDQKRNVDPLRNIDDIYQQFKDGSHTPEHLKGKGKWADDIDARLMAEPWDAKEFPEFDELMRANAPAFALLEEGARGEKFYWPNSSSDFVKKTYALPFNSLRGAGNLLMMRSMMSAGRDNTAAMRDVMTTARLGRVVSQEQSVVAVLIGIGLEAAAVEQAQRLASYLSAAELTQLADELEELGPLTNFAKAQDGAERLFMLGSIYIHSSTDSAYADFLKARGAVSGGAASGGSFVPRQMADRMRVANQWIDLVAQAAAVTNFTEYLTLRGKMRAFWETAPLSFEEVFQPTELDRQTPRSAESMLLTNLIVESRRRAGILWLRVLAHQKQHGSFPETLDGITNARLVSPFTGNPFVYEKTTEGFGLRCIGPDLADDREVDTPADGNRDGRDVVLRYPWGGME